MKIAILAAARSFEAQIVDATDRRAMFENTAAGIRQFERWALETYRRNGDVNLFLWDAEPDAPLNAFAQAAVSGGILFRSWRPWRSVNGLVMVDHMAHRSAQATSRRLGYDDVCLAAVVRRANGEFSARSESS
ncbi:hypothetical protein [Roseateles noduli]|uniref:hypothetical protein n=1 Tax=Roseateles noduli TaxID=2052484 RepID=UPI003D64969E